MAEKRIELPSLSEYPVRLQKREEMCKGEEKEGKRRESSLVAVEGVGAKEEELVSRQRRSCVRRENKSTSPYSFISVQISIDTSVFCYTKNNENKVRGAPAKEGSP